ncbi:MAG: hypothetical protein K9K39_02485 [Desulfohalobiaceae bacterium]|nr:hypothetical protein [Desulfohalobiaceae bacterium]
MLNKRSWVQDIYDSKGEFLGIFIGPEVWERVQGEVLPILRREINELEDRGEPEIREPLDDWENLKKFWGFNYPVDFDVQCEICGAETTNWQEDKPRLFLLKAASLSGLVTFQCRNCGAKILKKHFKDRITVETTATRDYS